MSDEIFVPAVLVTFNKKFKAIKVMGDKLLPVSINMKADLSYNGDEDSDSDATVSLTKIKLWVDTYLDNSVLVSIMNEWGLMTFFDEHGFPSTSSNPILFPSELVTDDMLAQLISRKLNAIGGEPITVGSVEIETENTFLSFIYTNEIEFDMPTMENWVGEVSYHSVPWWDRNDASSFDIFPSDDEDEEPLQFEGDPLEKYDLSFVKNELIKTTGSSASIIRPNFKPTVIEGGKDD